MKKLLIGTMLASGFVMSGDLAKCTEALEKFKKYSNLSTNTAIRSGELMTEAKELNIKDMNNYEIEKMQIVMVRSKVLADAWKKEAITECKGIVDKKYIKAE